MTFTGLTFFNNLDILRILARVEVYNTFSYHGEPKYNCDQCEFQEREKDFLEAHSRAFHPSDHREFQTIGEKGL